MEEMELDDGAHDHIPAWVQRPWVPRCLSIAVLAFYFLLAVPAGCYGASQFFDHLDFADFKPDSGSILAASNEFKDIGENQGLFWMAPMYIVLQSQPRGESLTEGLRAVEVAVFVDTLAQNLGSQGAWWEFAWEVAGIRSYFLPGARNTSLVGGINNDTTVISLNYMRFNFRHETKAAVEGFVNGALADASKLGTRYTASITGIPSLNSAMSAHVLPNMAFIDAIAIPTGLVVFAFATRSPLATLVPLVVILCAVTTGLGWGELLKHSMHVTGFAPELMATTVIGLSIDFSLFVVSRLREFHRNPAARAAFSPVELLYLTYARVAHNILVSGIAVAAAFGGLALIKSTFVRSIALLCMIGTLMTLLASLTVAPALLYFLYPCCFDVFSRCRKPSADVDVEQAPEVHAVNAAAKHRRRIHYHPSDALSFWGKAARFSTRRPLLVLAVAVVAAIFPLYVLVAHFDYDDSFFSSAPYTVPSWNAYANALKTFGREIDTPLTFFVSQENFGALTWQDAWPIFDAVVDEAVRSPDVQVSLVDIDAPNVLAGRRLTYNDSLRLLNSSDSAFETLLTSVMCGNVMPGWGCAWQAQPAAVVRIRMPTPAYGANGASYFDIAERWLHNAVLPAAAASPTPFRVGFDGANANSWWVMRRVMQQFPIEVAVTAIMLFVAILVLFRSLFFAVKLLVTMAFTVIMTFGLTITVYHYSWLRGVWHPLTEVNKLFWLIVVIAFSITCVLSLDYDVFLIVRVLEFRRVHRFNDVDSVVHAVSHTGPVISFAAFIMMVAFGALIFADTAMMNQFGLSLTLAVFVDAFIVRPILVPALIAVTPTRAVWFPRRMPQPAVWEEVDPDDQSSRLWSAAEA